MTCEDIIATLTAHGMLQRTDHGEGEDDGCWAVPDPEKLAAHFAQKASKAASGRKDGAKPRLLAHPELLRWSPFLIKRPEQDTLVDANATPTDLSDTEHASTQSERPLSVATSTATTTCSSIAEPTRRLDDVQCRRERKNDTVGELLTNRNAPLLVTVHDQDSLIQGQD
jgi:hypothetical protein